MRNSVPSRGGASHTISGNRECGLLRMRGSPFGETVGTILPEAVTIGSQRPVNSSPDECADGNLTTSCTVAASTAPWLALDFGKPAQVDKTTMLSYYLVNWFSL